MNSFHDQRAGEILNTTLRAVAARRRARARRRCAAGAAALAAMVAMVSWGLSSGRGGGNQSGMATAAPTEFAALPGIEESLPWDGPWALLLVASGEGLEMKAMSAGQIAELARKPGCEFAFTPDAVLVVSDYSSGFEAVPFDGTF